MDRRTFLAAWPAVAAARPLLAAPPPPRATTVRGPVEAALLGPTLVHEHVLVDFIGAGEVGRHRYDAEEAFRAALPHLEAVKERGARTLVECTPAWLGRDPALLARLSEASGLHIVTNTGYYGAAEDKYVPAHARAESAERLAERWTAEWRDGIEGTGIRPGFIKTGVDSGPLSPIDRKLVAAACLCHRGTGLRIHCHTGDGRAAMDILATLEAYGVSAEAFVWVHAQNEKDRALHLRAARAGAWIELDGVSEASRDAHVSAVVDLARAGHLARVLVSQDAGWYRVGEKGGGRFRPYTYLFDGFLPALRGAGLTEVEVRTLMVDNPARLLGRPAA
ncbi:MAG TPA: phosphotriesterase [Vicinamibacteria bacterium]|nr:phosphotriesterase [Vicinamibacteria bacterium]